MMLAPIVGGCGGRRGQLCHSTPHENPSRNTKNCDPLDSAVVPRIILSLRVQPKLLSRETLRVLASKLASPLTLLHSAEQPTKSVERIYCNGAA